MELTILNKKTYKLKTVQLIILTILLVFYSAFFFYFPQYRTFVRSNIYAIIACVCLWLFFLLSLISLYYDFVMMRTIAKISRNLNNVTYVDALTGIPNRHSLDLIFQSFSTPSSVKNVGCAVVRLDNLQDINLSKGYSAGDALLKDFATIFETSGSNLGYIGRNNATEFVIVIEDCNEDKIKQFLSTLADSMKIHNSLSPSIPATISYGYTLNSEDTKYTIRELLIAAYKHLNCK